MVGHHFDNWDHTKNPQPTPPHKPNDKDNPIHVPYKVAGSWSTFSFLFCNPFMLRAAKRGMMILNIFYLQKHFLEKHLKEKCLSEAKQQLSLKLFLNFRFIQKLFSKIWQKQTILSRESLSANGLKKNVLVTKMLPNLSEHFWVLTLFSWI